MRYWLATGFLITVLVATGCSGSSDSLKILRIPDGFKVAASESQSIEVGPDESLQIVLNSPSIAIKEVFLQTNKPTGKARLEVASLTGGLEAQRLPSAADTYQILEIAIDNLRDDDIDLVTISFTVERTWLDYTGYREEEVALQRFEDSWAILPTILTEQLGEEVEYRAISPGLSLFAITAVRAEAVRLKNLPFDIGTVPPALTSSASPIPAPDLGPTPTPTPPSSAVASPLTADQIVPTATVPPIAANAAQSAPQVPTPIATHTLKPTDASSPTPAANRTPTAIASATGAATHTPTPTFVQTSTEVLESPTRNPSPTTAASQSTPPQRLEPTPTPTTVPTATPAPAALPGDERFGVVLHTNSQSDNLHFLTQLGVKWYLNFNADMTQIPDGAHKLPFISVPTNPNVWNSGQTESLETLTDDEIAALGFFTRQQLSAMASASPGSHWYIFGEANRYGFMSGSRFAPVFHYFSTHIKLADPTAKIIGTSILNWDFTCIGCAGYQSGGQWLKEFIGAYEVRYGEKPPVDVWAIDTYPIDWSNTPNNDAQKLASYRGNDVMHWEIVTQQLEGMRQYLSTIPDYVDTPIWITEIAIHVGYDGWKYDPFPQLAPVGDYHWDNMGDYVINVLDWLDANADAYKIEKWFFFVTWKDIVDIGADGYMGITYFDGPSLGASRNCLGEIYRTRSLGESPVKCDAAGNTAPDN